VATLLGITTLVLSLVLLWTGLKHLRFSSLVGAVLSAVELLGLALSMISLGWWGLVALAFSNALAIMVWSVVLAARVERRLVYASLQADVSKHDMKMLFKWLGKQDAVRPIRPVERAELIRLLSERNRSVAEIRQMALPIAMLHVVHDTPLPLLVERCDRILRLAGEPAAEAMHFADVLTAGTQNSAVTLTEMLDALLAFYAGDADDEKAA
jgi:hypothetical protein